MLDWSKAFAIHVHWSLGIGTLPWGLKAAALCPR
jgi:hypothetical protein